MFEIKMTKIGNSTGVIFTKEMLSKLRVSKGDKLFAFETPNGIEITPYNLTFIRQMKLAQELIKENKDVLKKLAQ